MTVSPDGKLYVWGFAPFNNGIALPGAYQSTYGGNDDAFFVGFKPNGTPFYGTYYGGSNFEFQTPFFSGAAYSKGRVAFAYTTGSTSGIATTGAHQTSYAGSLTTSWGDAFLAQFEVDTFVYIQQPFTDTVVCSGDTLSIPYGVTQNFRNSNVFTFQLSGNTGSFASPTNMGTVTGNTGGKFNWVVPSSIASGTGYRVRVLASGPLDTAYEDANIKLNPTTVATATANTPLCSGNTLNLSGSSSVSGVTWNWAGPGGYTSTTQNPSRTSALTTYSGDYILTANMNGCTGKDTVTVLVKLTPATPTANNNGPLCNNGILNLTANSTTPGVSYNWSGPSYTSTTQNPTINPATTANSGIYMVYAELNGCSSGTATTSVSIVNGPSINMYPSPNDSICVGTTVNFTANPVNPGTGPGYQWLKNGVAIPGATGLTYSATGLIDGDNITFLLTPGTGAACNTPVNSNTIAMTVLQYTQPIVEIAGDTNAWPGLLVTFNVSNVSGGLFPKYQWKVNNQNIVGATSNTWGTTTLNHNDQVCVVMTPSFLCPNPATATDCKKMKVATGINSFVNNKLNVYPNPVNETLFIEGIDKGTRIQLFDVLGREVFNSLSTRQQETITTQQLPAGNYILQLSYPDGTRDNVKMVKE
jgi:hypothetical protein